jgi:hypothetical protein
MVHRMDSGYVLMNFNFCFLVALQQQPTHNNKSNRKLETLRRGRGIKNVETLVLPFFPKREWLCLVEVFFSKQREQEKGQNRN